MTNLFLAEIDRIILAILDSPFTYVILAVAVWLAPRFFDEFFPRTAGQKHRS